MRGRSRPLLIAGIALVSAQLLSAGREACAQQIVLSSRRGLDFGRFVAGSGGTVLISPDGLRSNSGGVVLLNSPSTGQAVFSVSNNGTDSGAKAVSITLPPNGSTRLASGNASMAVDNFVNSPASLLAVPSGGATLSVGATLTVAPNQPAGNYSGSFSLIIDYQ